MAALLTSVGDDKDKSAVYLAECRRMGIKVLPPDVNASAARFTAGRRGHPVRPGRGPQRRRQRGRVDRARAARRRAPYTDFYDFLRKVDAVVCNKKTIESLIKAGAFDSLGHTRKGLLAVHADAIDSFLDVKRNEAVGQFDLFGDAFGDDRRRRRGMVVTPPIPTGEWDKTDLLAFEREMLGLYVSDHPLFGLEHVLARRGRHRRSPRSTEEGTVADGADRHPRRHPLRGAAPDHQAGQGLGVGHPGGPGRRASRCCSSPTPTSWSGSTSPRTPSWWSRAGSTGATTSPGSWRWTCRIPDITAPDDGQAGRAGAAAVAVHAAAGGAAQGGAGQPPRHGRGAPQAGQRRAVHAAAARARCGSPRRPR